VEPAPPKKARPLAVIYRPCSTLTPGARFGAPLIQPSHSNIMGGSVSELVLALERPWWLMGMSLMCLSIPCALELHSG
jgi:hypothetical protein